MLVSETFTLSRRFYALMAVNGLTLAVEAGEIMGLQGPNGAGNTTVAGFFGGSDDAASY